MGGFFTVIFFILLIGGVLYVQVDARKQLTVESPLQQSAVESVIERYFGISWSREDGPGTFNYKPRLRKDAPMLSVACAGSDNGGTRVDIWVSGSTTMLGAMGHGMLMWRKKRGLAKRLAAARA